jgi:hypothetical protein
MGQMLFDLAIINARGHHDDDAGHERLEHKLHWQLTSVM